jgi:hypothetical protein
MAAAKLAAHVLPPLRRNGRSQSRVPLQRFQDGAQVFEVGLDLLLESSRVTYWVHITFHEKLYALLRITLKAAARKQAN